MTIQQHATFDSSAAELNATSKLVKAWESKNAKNAAKFGGISLMALSLAACGGGDNDIAAVVDGGTAADDTAVDDTAVVTSPVMSALQASGATLLTKIATSNTDVEAATIAAGSTAAVLDFNDNTVAPATAAAATTDATALIANLTTAITTTNILEASDGLGNYETLAVTLDAMVTAHTAVTGAQKTALASSDAGLAAAFAFEASSDSAAVNAALVAVNGNLIDTAAETAAAAGITAIGTHFGSNAASAALDGDTTPATTAELNAGVTAYAALIHAAILANDATYATAYGNLSAADQALIQTQLFTTVDGLATTAVDANTGMITNDTDTGASIIAVGDAIGGMASTLSAAGITTITPALDLGGDNAIGGAAANADTIDLTNDETITTVNGVAAANPNETTMNIINAASDAAFDAAYIAAYNDVLTSVRAITAADEASQIAAIEAANVATVTLGVDNIDIDGGAATTGNDVYIFNEAGGNLSVGTAATVAAPENVLFGAGDDSVIILGEYTATQFVTIATAADQAALGTTAVGDASVLEAFVYQNATTGDTVISFEENAFDGSTTTGTAMTTLTLVDVSWAGVTAEVVDGYTILSETAVIA